MLTVSEETLSRALLLCLERAKLVVEPAGAAAVAACSITRDAFEPPVVVVLSGGNIDPLLLSKVLRHGLTAAGRYLDLPLPHPGPAGRSARPCSPRSPSSAPTWSTWCTNGWRPACGSSEVEVLLQVETRGPDALRRGDQQRVQAAGYTS